MRIFTFLLYFLFSGSLLFSASKIPSNWAETTYCRRDEGNLSFTAPWTGSDPLLMIVQSEATGEAVRVEFSSASLKVLTLPEIGFEEKPLRVKQLYAYPEEKLRPSMPFLIKFREDRWSFYLDGRICASLAAPFPMPGYILFPQNTMLAPEKARFQPIPRVSYSTDFMIEEGAPNQLYPWEIQNGSWRIHTALEEAKDRPETDQDRLQKAPLSADKSPNFYSLKGGGENAVITTGYEFFDNYYLSGSLQIEEGEAGIVFYYQGDEEQEGNEEITNKAVAAEYYALTLLFSGNDPDKREIRLWHYSGKERRYLARAQVPLYDIQWYQPAVKVLDEQIICYLDDFEVFRVKEKINSGGKIGFYANSKEELRFDDVLLKHYNELSLRNLGEIKAAELKHSGAFYKEPGWFSTGDDENSTILKAKAGEKNNESLILGRPWGENIVFSFQAETSSQYCKLGLIAGWKDKQKDNYLFSIEKTDEGQKAVLWLMKGNKKEKELDSLQLQELADSFNLQLDASEAGLYRFLLNEQLIFVLRNEEKLQGAAGIWLGKNSTANFSDLHFSREKEVNKEQEQKNPVFQADSFMRHWASPEGQWIAGLHDAYWHKGDFFNDFYLRLPVVPGSDLQLAVDGEAEQGAIELKISEEALNFILRENEEEIIQTYEFSEEEKKDIAALNYEFYCEGLLVWLNLNGKFIFEQRLSKPLKEAGNRVFVKGLKIPDLAKSKVTRSRIIDEFFNESPYAWIRNGGDWQIINRFQCTPSWSHMIAEAPGALAAFWRKQLFKGDLTLEFYAGSRQGYYDNAGNLNCTIMASESSPSKGYTFNCTEWDHNQSQNWSRFYKNGEIIGESEAYLVPRRRKGMVRRVLNPLVSAGRPMHGAWYYIKIRKIGELIEFYFDDEKIFSTTDEDVLNEGLLGIWTFDHSMTLAQIKITYEECQPRSFPVKMLPLDAEEECLIPEKEEELFVADFSGFPVDPLHKKFWNLMDPVGQSIREYFPADATAVKVSNKLGSGNMQLQSLLPATKWGETAGWFLRLKHTEEARFNLAMLLEKVNEDKKIQLLDRFFYQISGPAFTDGNWSKIGEGKIETTASIDQRNRNWQELFAWIPSSLKRGDWGDKNLLIKLHSLGIHELDLESSGMAGNGPDQQYAVATLQPVFYSLPEINMPEGAVAFIKKTEDMLFGQKCNNAEELKKLLENEEKEGLNRVKVLFRQNRKNIFQELLWIKVPEEIDITLNWDENVPDALRLTNNSVYPDPRFADIKVKIASVELKQDYDNTESRLIRLPTDNQELQKAFADNENVTVIVSIGEKEKEIVLPMQEQRNNAAPVLCKLEGFSPFFKNYETENQAETNLEKIFLSYENSDQNQYLEISNNAGRGRLYNSYRIPFSLASYPVFQFRYRADDMSHISLQFVGGHQARLSPEDVIGGTVAVRHSTDFVRDEQWRTWFGVVSDSFNKEYFSLQRFIPGGFHFRSCSNLDQTGIYSKLAIDDLVFGPAVNSADQLEFTPHYEDFDGVETVFYSILKGVPAYWDCTADKLAELKWQETKPGTAIKPDLTDIEDGIHHILIKAVDKLGAESVITDLPFMLDRKPLQVSHQFRASNDALLNGVDLLVNFNNNGAAPWAIDKAVFEFAGKQRRIAPWSNRYIHNAQQDLLVLNYPLIMRGELNAAKDGDTIEFVLKRLEDGAANQTADYVIPVKVDYASDKEGPTWESQKFPTTTLLAHNWDGRDSNRKIFSAIPAARNADVYVSNRRGQSAYLVSNAHNRRATISMDLKWKPAEHPYLSFRLQCLQIRESMLLHVLLTTNDNKKVYTISLTTPRKNVLELNRTETFTWKAKEWQNFSFDVKQLLLDSGMSEETLQKLEVTSLGFRRLRVENGDPMLLDDLFIQSAPESMDKADVLSWNAFDKSGIASLEVFAVNKEGKDEWQHSFALNEVADLNVLRKKVKGLQWLRCSAKDKAGNLSIPFWMPLQGD